MDFQQTCLPDQPVFRAAFDAGWSRYLAEFNGNDRLASAQYMRGPVAMARLICEHGDGDGCLVAAAACLAGPAVFSDRPECMDHRLVEFSRQVRGIGSDPQALDGVISATPASVRIFLQASAILLLEQLADTVTSRRYEGLESSRTYAEALRIYSVARGFQDSYRLDTRFEIAAMKATTVMRRPAHIWSRQQNCGTRAHV